MGRPPTLPLKKKDGWYLEVRNKGAKTGTVLIRDTCTLVEPVEPPVCELPNCLDRDDQKFLELARDSRARALLSRDKLVLKHGRRPVIAARFAILTPERLQALLPSTP